jgi:hypothetical protein
MILEISAVNCCVGTSNVASLCNARDIEDTDKDTALVGEVTYVDKGNIVLSLLQGQYRL